MYEKLTGRLHSKSYSQQLNFQVETIYKWCLSVVHIGTNIIIIFINT